jgi:outer membrane lipoprotein-sorting protein
MRGNRHPITDAGIGRLVAIVMDNYLRAAKTGEATVAYRGEEAVYGRTTYHVGVALPPQKEKGYYAKDMDIWVDKELGLPIKIMIYGWQGELVESYGYRDLRLNPGLKDSEFDPDFKSYGF